MATETAIPVPRLIGTDGLGALFEALVADGYHVIGPAALLLAAITPHWGSWRRNGSAGRRLVTRTRASTAITPSGRAMTGLRSSSATCGKSPASQETRSRMSRRPSRPGRAARIE